MTVQALYYDVKKVVGNFYVFDWNHEPVVAYRQRKDAEAYANGASWELVNEAERHNDRRDFILEYLRERSLRPKIENAQFDLFA